MSKIEQAFGMAIESDKNRGAKESLVVAQEEIRQLDEAFSADRPELMYTPEILPRTIALFHVLKGLEGRGETIAIDFDAGERGRIGRLNPSGFYVRNIIKGNEKERIRFVQRYLEMALGESLARKVVDSALREVPMQTQYKNPVEEGYVVTNTPPVLPLERVVTYKFR